MQVGGAMTPGGRKAVLVGEVVLLVGEAAEEVICRGQAAEEEKKGGEEAMVKQQIQDIHFHLDNQIDRTCSRTIKAFM